MTIQRVKRMKDGRIIDLRGNLIVAEEAEFFHMFTTPSSLDLYKRSRQDLSVEVRKNIGRIIEKIALFPKIGCYVALEDEFNYYSVEMYGYQNEIVSVDLRFYGKNGINKQTTDRARELQELEK